MDKGWGLTLDSDPISNLFSNKTGSTAGHFFSLKQQRDMFQFPVSIAGSREDRHGTSSPASDDNRLAVDEVDFFSGKKHRVVDDRDDDKTNTVNVKKETDLNVNVSVFYFQNPFNFLNCY